MSALCNEAPRVFQDVLSLKIKLTAILVTIERIMTDGLINYANWSLSDDNNNLWAERYAQYQSY